MRRPTRTRRLSIAAMASLLAFAVAAGVVARSFWIWDNWGAATYGRVALLEGGCVEYVRISPPPTSGIKGHISGPLTATAGSVGRAIWGFSVRKGPFPNRSVKSTVVLVTIPLWPLLLPLLIAPVSWLVARPESAPAFPVVTDAKHGSA